MAQFTQDNRPLRVSTPLGKNVLLLERWSGEEAVSVPFQFTLEMLSENSAVDPAALVRKPVAVTIVLPGGGERVVHGLVSRFTQLGRRAGLSAYRAEVVPWLWFLSLSNDCRIFQKLSVSEIAEQLFKEAGFTDFKFKLLKPLAQREYCVQYRESTLAFVSRLLEEEGVFYFFEHTEDDHTLVLTDHGRQQPSCPVVGELRMTASDSYVMVDEPVVTSLAAEHAAITGAVSLSSFDYEHPTRNLLVSVAGEQPNESYDYFGGYTEKADGDRYARMRLEQIESQQHIVHGESNCPSLTAGHKFDLTEHANLKLNQEYHLLSVHHSAAMSNYGTDSGTFEYSNSFEAIPHEVAYRPPLRTLRPVVHGTQTAIVTGPGGEEIYVDKLGRVKVHFHWDRKGKSDETSSCWVRVSSAWAGKGFGNFSAPRIGQEVIVDFLEGDPDQPIIVGRVYNGDQAPPCDPGGKGGVISGLRSKTHKGSGFNEMTMDDTAGKEKVSINAQYDMITNVGHDDTQTVKNNRTVKITDGNLNHDVVAGTATYHVTGAVTENFDATQKTTVKNDITIVSTSGPIAIAADAQHVYIKGTTSIQLRVGASMIWMDSGGQISIEGVNVTIKGSSSVTVKGGTVHSEADSEHQTKGAIVLSEGSATNTIKGGMVMLNP
ncbi:MAG TPA: type VI secretion system tip protein TssI/VgrG [Gemmatimonadaceae bacterium]|nr:type VI secretion system tip protein TssI/VgrG [Gemmatimonadaceae bacterium]